MAYTDVGGTPVEVSPEAWEAIMLSGQQGSIFPQALAEVFGDAGFKVTIRINCVPKAVLFPGAGEAEKMVITTIIPGDLPATELAKAEYVAYTNYDDLCEPRHAGRRGFHAVDTAREFVRLYRLFYGI